MTRLKPLESAFFGLLAGAAGSFVQDLFFRATRRLAPDAAAPTEPPEQTAGRQIIEAVKQDLASDPQIARTRALVHYGVGARAGEFYGLARETFPVLARPWSALGIGTFVFGMKHAVMLPLLGARSTATAAVHGYRWLSHLVYGAVTVAAYEALRRRPWLGAISALAATRRLRRLPARIRPGAKPIFKAGAGLARFGRRFADAGRAFAS